MSVTIAYIHARCPKSLLGERANVVDEGGDALLLQTSDRRLWLGFEADDGGITVTQPMDDEPAPRASPPPPIGLKDGLILLLAEHPGRFTRAAAIKYVTTAVRGVPWSRSHGSTTGTRLSAPEDGEATLLPNGGAVLNSRGLARLDVLRGAVAASEGQTGVAMLLRDAVEDAPLWEVRTLPVYDPEGAVRDAIAAVIAEAAKPPRAPEGERWIEQRQVALDFATDPGRFVADSETRRAALVELRDLCNRVQIPWGWKVGDSRDRCRRHLNRIARLADSTLDALDLLTVYGKAAS